MTSENGIIIKVSSFDFDTTYQKIKETIENNPNLKIILELDHSQNAAKNDLELAPTRLILFGNPKAGTPLMQAQQTVGLDLPQKILVFEENKTVKVAYNDPQYLASRHEIKAKDELIGNISGALNKITDISS